jgi:transposase
LERLETLDREGLIQIILDQQRMIEELRAEIEQWKGKKGSAAPFSKGTHKSNPKPPGRKPGQGFFRFRSEPAAAAEPVRVPVAGCCPACGGALGEAREELVSITDIPVERCAEVRFYAVETRPCRQCGKSVRGWHPDVADGQRGATAHRVGPRIKALAHVLHFAHGVPVRKTPAILEELTGVRLTQGAITQDAMKQAAGIVGARYEQLRALVAKQAVVHTDDTGWRVGGCTAYLMAFVNSWLAVYQIRNRHRNEEVRELVPADFAGVMVCDRGKSYDATELLDVAQQKCLAHLLRNAAEVAEKKTGRAKEFSQKLKDLLKAALALRAAKTGLEVADYRQRAEKLDGELTLHLRNRILRDDDNQRLLNGVGTQQDRGNLLRFLYRDGIEATNNRAERELRPAVIARKVSHCSRNERGARAFEAFASVIQTLRKTTDSTIGAAFANLAAPAPETSP